MGKLPDLRLARFAVTVGAALSLQGCIAAVFPLAAGGLMGERTLSGEEAEGGSVSVAANIPVEDVSSTEPATTDSATEFATPNVEEPDPALAAAPSAREEPVVINADRASEALQSDLVSRESSPRPVANVAPSATPRSVPAPTSPIPTVNDSFAINQLLSYANQRQIASGQLPASAMLADRISLEPEREECNGITPTVLIDLDPEGGLFDPSTAARPPAGLGIGLARLRLTGVTIAWISANPIGSADAIRLALARTGLDINDEDRLLLLRDADDRKQKLREELAEISCLIAIAGDTRSDFDELYDYLKNPDDAQSLEPLIGDGWFLIPQPLLSERPNP